MKYLTLSTLLFCSFAQAHAIELIINGKTYQIESYQIENNGQRIVIPDLAVKVRKPSSFESLMNDLEGGYKKLEKSLEGNSNSSKTRKRNFR